MPDRRDALTPNDSQGAPGPDDGRWQSRWRVWARKARADLAHFARTIKWPRIKWPRGVGIWALWIGGGLFGTLALFVFAFFLALHIYTPDLPFDGDLYALNRPVAFIFQDAQGRTIGRTGAATGVRVAMKDMPPYLPAAFLAMEDRRFYDHGGIDYRGLIRALYVDLTAGHIVQGGSTITQQTVKTIFLSPQRTLSRKLEEMAASRELESRLTKNEILELYLNRIYLGSGAYGVDGAARTYFGKSARQVTLAEAAMLASLTKAPSVFSPRRDLAAAQERASRVLDAMVETGAITPAEAADARAHPAAVADQTQNVVHDYFFDAAADEVKRLLPGAEGDLIVLTTIDMKLQSAAEKTVVHALDTTGARSHATQAALVAMNTDGAVRALVGGRDYAESAFNRATQAHRQPGSAFKPFVYLTAFEEGISPQSVRVDEPVDLPGYAPENYRRNYAGAMTLHRALVHSVNTIAVQLCVEVGPSAVAATAHRLGIRSPLQAFASLALGTSEVTPLELTAAFAAFPTGGMRVTPYMVTEVRSAGGRVIYHHQTTAPVRVVEEEKALWMNSVLYDVVQSGTGTAARVPGHEVAGKTGTTSDFRDAWFVGYSADLVTGVWLGNDDSSPMRHVSGSGLPAEIWSGFMRTALNGVEARAIPRSEPEADVDLFGGLVGGSTESGEYTTDGTLTNSGSMLGDEDIVDMTLAGEGGEQSAPQAPEEPAPPGEAPPAPAPPAPPAPADVAATSPPPAPPPAPPPSPPSSSLPAPRLSTPSANWTISPALAPPADTPSPEPHSANTLNADTNTGGGAQPDDGAPTAEDEFPATGSGNDN